MSTTATQSPATPRYARARQAAQHFAIAESTLWHWARTRADFPKPTRAGEKTTLFDLAAIEQYLRRGSK
jgi:predicted DNA-binding transcriptional regulator AlpA